jgi:hypothetical protein
VLDALGSVSIEPNIIVAVVGMPSSCASRITPSHSSGLILRALMRLRTRSTKISAPAPGSDLSPAAEARRARRAASWPSTFESPTISETESEWMSTPGYSAPRAEEPLEPLDAQFGIDAALDHDLRRALIRRELHAFEHLVVRHRVAFAVPSGRKKAQNVQCTLQTFV